MADDDAKNPAAPVQSRSQMRLKAAVRGEPPPVFCTVYRDGTLCVSPEKCEREGACCAGEVDAPK